MTSKYDKLLPEILEDLKLMSQSDCERKHHFRSNFLSPMLKRWKWDGMLPADYKPPCKFKRRNFVLPKVVIEECNKPVPPRTIPHIESHNLMPKNEPHREPVRLPPFDNTWPSEVKVEWMKAYTAVVGRAKTIPFKEELKNEGLSR